MKATDYRAVSYDGACYCYPDCLPEGWLKVAEVRPIYASEEADYYPICTVCGKEHDYIGLTEFGQRYQAEREALQAAYAETLRQGFVWNSRLPRGEFLTLTARDVGKLRIHRGNIGIDVSFMGRVQAIDVGKRLYFNGVWQVENNEQRDARLARGGG